MTMPSPDPCPQSLADRSASFNRADFNKSMRTKASTRDSLFGAESLENLTDAISSGRHVRHSSLDSSHGSALHPINLNSKFENLFSSIWQGKALTKPCVDQADTENIVFSAANNVKEVGRETQEELILEPHESLFQDAQEESFSTSMSAESKSPREDLNFILWGNAAFCLPEARDLLTGGKALDQRRQTDGPPGKLSEEQNNLPIDKNHQHLHSMEECLYSPAAGRSCLLSSKNAAQGEHSALSTKNDAMSVSSPKKTLVSQNEESLKCHSSVGSTLSVSNCSTQRQPQTQILVASSPQSRLMSSEAQSCFNGFDTQDLDVSASAISKRSGQTMQEPCSTKRRNSGKEDGGSICNQQTSQTGGVVTFQEHDVVQQVISRASDEVKIRAELELEIEQDLEQELRTKIYLLSRRLEELHVLKANRYVKQEGDETQVVAGSLFPINEKDEAHVGQGAAETPLSIPSKSPLKNRVSIGHRESEVHEEKTSARTYLTLNKKQLQILENDELSRETNPVSMASGSAPRLKERAQPPSTADGEQNTKGPKDSTEGLASWKTKLHGDNMPRFKQDVHSWTVGSNAKKFDWIRTLRTDEACTPRVSLWKKGSEEAPPFVTAAKETIHGNVSRNLFSEESLSASSKKKPVKSERAERPMTPTMGSSKRSAFSSAKIPSDAVPSTPHVPKATCGPVLYDIVAASAASKRITSQKPALCNHSPCPMSKISDLRRTRTATSITPIQQPCSCKKSNAVENSSSSTRSLKTVSPTHAEKIKRSASAPPGVPARCVSSKENKSSLSKTIPSNKQAGSLQQIRANRIASQPKPAISSTQMSKGRAGLHSESSIKKLGMTMAKPTGASRGKWY